MKNTNTKQADIAVLSPRVGGFYLGNAGFILCAKGELSQPQKYSELALVFESRVNQARASRIHEKINTFVDSIIIQSNDKDILTLSVSDFVIEESPHCLATYRTFNTVLKINCDIELNSDYKVVFAFKEGVTLSKLSVLQHELKVNMKEVHLY